MAAWGYEFDLLVLKVSLTLSLRSLLRALEDKIRIPARPCNILYNLNTNQNLLNMRKVV